MTIATTWTRQQSLRPGLPSVSAVSTTSASALSLLLLLRGALRRRCVPLSAQLPSAMLNWKPGLHARHWAAPGLLHDGVQPDGKLLTKQVLHPSYHSAQLEGRVH